MNTPFFSHALSHMGWPARPAKPIYQPEVAAEGIWLAARSNHSELFITGTTELFSLATRFMPGVIGWCVSQLGMERQLTRDHRAIELCEPTLFHPSDRVRGQGTVQPSGAGMEHTGLAAGAAPGNLHADKEDVAHDALIPIPARSIGSYFYSRV